MLANVGSLDRALRILAGLVLVALAYTDHERDWGWLGLLPLLSGLTRHCPIYARLGISTCGGR